MKQTIRVKSFKSGGKLDLIILLLSPGSQKNQRESGSKSWSNGKTGLESQSTYYRQGGGFCRERNTSGGIKLVTICTGLGGIRKRRRKRKKQRGTARQQDATSQRTNNKVNFLLRLGKGRRKLKRKVIKSTFDAPDAEGDSNPSDEGDERGHRRNMGTHGRD